MRLSRPARWSLVATGAMILFVGLMLLLRNLWVDPAVASLELVETRADGTRVYQGSWLFPRGGPYKVGFEAPTGGGRLFIDGIEIRRRPGELVTREPWRGRPAPDAPRSGRKPYDPGVVGVRFEAPPDARLLWVPPGRRSDPEYVPPNALSPEPPERATFSDWAGARPVDGIFATLIALALALWLGFLFRRQLRAWASDRPALLAFAGVLAGALVVRLIDLGGAGETWDENTNWSAGRNYVVNLLSLDFSESSWRWNYEHPPVMKYIAGLGAQWADGYGPARALSALVSALACALMVPIGRRLFSLRVGVLAGAACALTPHLVAHGKIVGHEAPTVLWWTLAIWLCLRAFDEIDADRWRDDPVVRRQLILRFAGIGLVLGLAVFSRFANLLLAPMIGSVLLWQAPRGLRRQTVLLGLAVIPIAAIAVGFLLWPRLWSEPLTHLGESWDKLKKPHSPEPFLGATTNVPPRYYFAAYLVATAPIGILFGAVAWIARAARWRERGSLVVALWLLVPMIIALSPVRQDGVRYIMPAVVALSLAAAAGIDYAAGAVSNRLARAHWIAGGILIIHLAIECVRIHPLYLDYYGHQVGGTDSVAESRRFEVAWWGEGLEDAIDYVNRHAEPDARVFKGCISPYDHLGWLRGDLWRSLAHRPEQADWIIVYQPTFSGAGCRVPTSFSPAYRVSFSSSSSAPAAAATVYRRADSAASPPR